MGKYTIRVGAKETGHAWSDPSCELSENRLAAYTNHADGKTFRDAEKFWYFCIDLSGKL